MTITNATRHNLNNLTVEIPLGRFVALTGVSGSGKTTLVREVLLPALQDRRMRTYGEAVVFETEQMTRPWGQSGVVDFGAFVKFAPPVKEGEKKPSEKLEGLVHISELAWQLIDDPREMIKTGDQVEAKIIGIEETRISLSMKALKKDPWDAVLDKYKVGDIVAGKVDKINHFGAFVYLDKDIHGLAHVSEFQDVYPGKKIEEVFKEGESYSWTILSIEPKSHRMGLLPVKEGKDKKVKEAVTEEVKEVVAEEKAA